MFTSFLNEQYMAFLGSLGISFEIGVVRCYSGHTGLPDAKVKPLCPDIQQLQEGTMR